jgi:acid phosphatase
MKLLVLCTFVSVALALPQLTKHQATSFQQWGFLIFENTDYSTAEANPTFQQIQNLNNNRLLTNYEAMTHPSLPNYLASIAGSFFGISDDGSPSTHNLSAPTVLDLLESKGLTWKMYAENYPGNCFTGATNGIPHSYAAKHVPAIYFQSINTNPTRCANIVPATEFETDFQAGNLPDWWYYVPNLDNDAHDTSLAYAASYLQSTWLPRFTNASFTTGLAMVLTFDETASSTGPNHVYAALIGGAVSAGAKTDNTAYNHYSLIKTVENNWNLGSLGTNDVSATPITI